MSFTMLGGQTLAEPQTEKETVTDCFAESDLADFATMLLAGAEDDCVGSNFVMGEGKLSLFVRCDFGPGQRFAGEVKGTYDRSHFELFTVVSTDGDSPSKLVASVSATWIGSCEALG